MKARVVAETLLPGVNLNDVARQHGLSANYVSSWRTRARHGRLVLPAPEDPMEFAALVVGSDEDKPLCEHAGTDRPEIVAGAVVIRLEAGGHGGADCVDCARLGWAPVMVPSNRVRVLVSTKPIDFRKGRDGLVALLSSVLRNDPFTGTTGMKS